MELSIEIKNKVESLLEGYKLPLLKRVASELSENYLKESGKGISLVNSELDAKVYASIRMPATYKAISDSLEHILELYEGEIRTVIDAGAGVGTGAFVCNELLDLQSVTCLEKSDVMRKVGNEIMSDFPIKNLVKWKNFDLISNEIDETTDLVICSYVLNELEEKARKVVVEKLFNATDKVLLIVEPGTPVGSSIVREIRTQLLSMGGHIIAPCPHEHECPMKGSDWCHFSGRTSRSKLHKLLKGGDVPYEDEKYSYIAISKSPCKRCDSRVLRHPIINKSSVGLTLCGDNIEKVDIRKSDKEKYRKARKVKVGDTF